VTDSQIFLLRLPELIPENYDRVAGPTPATKRRPSVALVDGSGDPSTTAIRVDRGGLIEGVGSLFQVGLPPSRSLEINPADLKKTPDPVAFQRETRNSDFLEKTWLKIRTPFGLTGTNDLNDLL